MPGKTGIALVSCLAALALAAPAADAYIYWGDGSTGTIGRATNEGTGVEPNFITGVGNPSSLTVDSNYLYWGDEKFDAVGRAKLDGTEVRPKFINAGTEVSGVAVSGSYVFWSELIDSTIGRANLDGSSPDDDLIKEVAVPCGLAVDSGHLYWLSQANMATYIGRSDFGGLDKKEKFATLPLGFQCGIAVDSLHIYWADRGLGFGTIIGRADISNGKGVDNSFIGELKGVCGIAVFGSQLYWGNLGTNTIGRATLGSGAATDVNRSFIATGGAATCGVAADALAPPPPPGPPVGPQQPPVPGGAAKDTTPPETTITSGPGKKLAKGKAKFAFKADEPGSRFECKLNGKKYSSCTSPKSYAGLKPGRHTFRVRAIDAAGNSDATPAKRRFRVPAP